MTSSPPASKPLRAILDVADFPASLYGQGQARITRRLVHIMLAKHANPDGTAIYPSKQKLAEECAGITEYTLGQMIKWLEDHKLVRRLPELHPRLGTIQYELQRPDPDEVEQGKQEATARVVSRREGTRKRTEEWRARKRQATTVTQTVGVTSGDGDANSQRTVTQPCDAVTLGGDAVTQRGDACDAENPAFSPSTVLLDRPFRPSVIPSNPPPANSDGGTDGDHAHSESKSNAQASRASYRGVKEIADDLTEWMSDVLLEHCESRFIPDQEDQRRMQYLLCEVDAAIVVGAIYKFLARPKGFAGLADPFGMFWKEFDTHIKDASQAADEDDSNSVVEFLSEMHTDVFHYDSIAREMGKQLPSMSLLDRVLSIIGIREASTESVC